MEFVHEPYVPGETIAAIATPPGEGGVAIIRISGDEALLKAGKIFSKDIQSLESHRVTFGKIVNRDGEKVDEVLLLPMHAPRTYTGEETVEIFCHGGSLITRRVLETVLEAGVRQARPGEFTFKAFINGKLDLAQAEAVQDLIGAKNELALDAAERQLEGALSKRVNSLQERMTLVAAILEASVDYPDEGLEFISKEELISRIKEANTDLEGLIGTFHEGKILHEGLSLSLVGAPNVGKSSLMNALLDRERAIVSPIAGTTRDVLEDHLRLGGLNFRVLDTAGIRLTDECIEKEGIRRSFTAIEEADLVLLVADATDDLPEFSKNLPKEKTLLVWNKCDIQNPPAFSSPFSATVKISALKKEGLDELKKAIDQVIWKKGPPSKSEIIITNVRHKQALLEAKEALENLEEGLLSSLSPELLSLEAKAVLKSLGKILGTNVGEDILNSIFRNFCIGK